MQNKGFRHSEGGNKGGKVYSIVANFFHTSAKVISIKGETIAMRLTGRCRGFLEIVRFFQGCTAAGFCQPEPLASAYKT
jgi:hypothetical protein